MIDACNVLNVGLGLECLRREQDQTKQRVDDTSAQTCIGLQQSSSSSQQDQALLKAAENLADYNVRLRMFLLRLCDPDDLGHSVSAEVRQLAVELATSQRFGKDHCDFHNPTTHDRSAK